MKEYGKKKWSDSSSEVAHESTIPRHIAPFPDEMNMKNEHLMSNSQKRKKYQRHTCVFIMEIQAKGN